MVVVLAIEVSAGFGSAEALTLAFSAMESSTQRFAGKLGLSSLGYAMASNVFLL